MALIRDVYVDAAKVKANTIMDLSGNMRNKTPHAHQIKGSRYLIDRKSGFLFFKQRLGKCFTCIIALKELKEFPVLIVCPKIVIETWRTELTDERCKPDSIRIVDYNTPEKNTKALQTRRPIVIVNFEKIKNYDILNAKKWRIIIVDELHRLANVDSFVTRYFLRNRQPQFQRRWGLSGTPAPETAVNLVTEYIIIQGNFMGYKSYNKYLLENWVSNEFTGKWELQDRVHRDEIDAYVKRTACLATMADIGKGAQFRFTRRMIRLDKAQKRVLAKVKATKDASRGRSFTEGGMGPAILVARLHEKMVCAGIDPYEKKIISEVKIKECVDYWDWYREPLIVVSAFRNADDPDEDIVERTALRFREAGARVAVIHGDIKYKERERLRLLFLAGKFDVVAAQTQAIEVGLDFSIADTLMVMSNLDSGGSREQILERINHMNATGIKEIIDIEAEGTKDVRVRKDLEKKGRDSMRYFKK